MHGTFVPKNFTVTHFTSPHFTSKQNHFTQITSVHSTSLYFTSLHFKTKSLHTNHVSSLHITTLHLFTFNLRMNSLSCIILPRAECKCWHRESEQKFVQPTPLIHNDWSYHPSHYLVIQVIHLSWRGWWWFPPHPPGNNVLYDVAGEENTSFTPTRSSNDLIVSVNFNDVSYLVRMILKITV